MNKDVDVAYKAAFRRLSLRWHPDKFQAKCGSQIPREQQAALIERVSVIFQCVSTQWQQHVSNGHVYTLCSLQHLQSLNFMGNLTCGSMHQTALQLQNHQSCSCPSFPLAGDQPDCSYKKAMRILQYCQENVFAVLLGTIFLPHSMGCHSVCPACLLAVRQIVKQ